MRRAWDVRGGDARWDTATARCTSLTAMARGRRAGLPGRQRSARDDPANGQPTGGHRARRADPGHLPPRGPEGAVRRGHLAHRRTTPLTGCPKAHNHGQNACRVSHPPPPQQNHTLATSRRKPASRANGLIYVALGRVRYPAKRLLQATETGSGRIRAYPGVPSD